MPRDLFAAPPAARAPRDLFAPVAPAAPAASSAPGPFPAGDPRNDFLAQARARVSAGERAPAAARHHDLGYGMSPMDQPQGLSFRQAQEWGARADRGTLADAGQGVNQGFSLGFGDELMAGAFTPLEMAIGHFSGEDEGKSFGQRASDAYARGIELQGIQREAAQERSPAAYTAGQVAGSLVVPAKATSTVRGAVGQGAAIGGLSGFGGAEGGFTDRLDDAAIGIVGGGLLSGAVQSAAGALANRAARASIPSTDELRAAGTAAYKAADDAGLIFRPEAVQTLGARLRDDLTAAGYHPQLQPRIGTVLSEVERLSQGNVTLAGIDTLRKIARAAGSSTDASERALAGQIVSRIDEMVEGVRPADVLTGDAEAGAAALTAARDYWSRFRKSDALDDATERAADRAGPTGNRSTATRQEVRRFLESPKTSRGLTPAEEAAARTVVRGTPLQKLAGAVGQFSPRSNSLMGAVGLGGLLSNPTTALPAMIVAEVAKRHADRATPANVRALSETIRSGGKTAREIVTQALLGQGAPEVVDAVRSLMERSARLRGLGAQGFVMGAQHAGDRG